MKNINFNTDILVGDKAEVHTENLRIANLNLQDFNRRTNNNVSIRYNDKDCEFSLVNFDMNIEIANDINLYISWKRNIENDNRTYQQTFIRDINSEYERITQDFRSRKMTGNITQQDQKIFNSRRAEFVSKYQNFCPIGILNEEQENAIKSMIKKRFIDPIVSEN